MRNRAKASSSAVPVVAWSINGSIFICPALARMSCSFCSIPGSPLTMTATRRSPGTSSRSSCNRVAIASDEVRDRPVTFPRGCASLATTPRATGSSTPTMTIGIVAVARFAASVAGVPAVTRMATPEPISSLRKPGNCSARSSAHRSTMVMLLPSVQPSAERFSRNASRRPWLSCRSPAWIKPMRGALLSAKTGLRAIAVPPASNSKSRRLIR